MVSVWEQKVSKTDQALLDNAFFGAPNVARLLQQMEFTNNDDQNKAGDQISEALKNSAFRSNFDALMKDSDALAAVNEASVEHPAALNVALSGPDGIIAKITRGEYANAAALTAALKPINNLEAAPASPAIVEPTTAFNGSAATPAAAPATTTPSEQVVETAAAPTPEAPAAAQPDPMQDVASRMMQMTDFDKFMETVKQNPGLSSAFERLTSKSGGEDPEMVKGLEKMIQDPQLFTKLDRLAKKNPKMVEGFVNQLAENPAAAMQQMEQYQNFESIKGIVVQLVSILSPKLAATIEGAMDSFAGTMMGSGLSNIAALQEKPPTHGVGSMGLTTGVVPAGTTLQTPEGLRTIAQAPQNMPAPTEPETPKPAAGVAPA